MRAIILVAVVMLTALAANIVQADRRIYIFDLVGQRWVPVGRESSFFDSATLCLVGQCFGGIDCNACHSQAVDRNRYAQDREMRHEKIHFPKYALRLAESQTVPVGTVTVTRTKGLLVLRDQQGRTFQLPPDALLVTGKDGKPAFITYMGVNPPQPVK